MVKKLQRKLVILLSMILWFVLIASLFVIVELSYHSMEREFIQKRTYVGQKMRKICRDKIEEKEREELIAEVCEEHEVYAVVVDLDGEIICYPYSQTYYDSINTAVQTIFQSDEVQALLALAEGKEDQGKQKDSFFEYGRVDSYRYRIKSTKDGMIISYFSMDSIYNDLKNLIIISAAVGFVGMVVLLFVSLGISLLITKPVEESYNRQKQFIADASHELKTPLAVIDVNLAMIEKKEEKQKYISYIRQESRKMNQLISELLTLATVENGEDKREKQTILFSDVAEGVVCSFEALAYENGVTLLSQIEEGVSMKGCEEELERLISILLDNAIKHADYEKKVVVRLWREKNHCVLCVENTGKEIPKQEQKKIFERFYRADKARSRKEGRYGLGLSIAKAIVERHGGKIVVCSERGKTSFTVKF